MKLQQFAQASNPRQAFRSIQRATLETPKVKLASKIIKKGEKLSSSKNSKLVKVDPFPLLVTIATFTQETSNVSHQTVAKPVICEDVKMLLSLNKFAPSVMLPRKCLNWKKRLTKQSVKKQEIVPKLKLIISIPLLEENNRPVQPVNENSLCHSKKSLTVSINLEEKSDQI